MKFYSSISQIFTFSPVKLNGLKFKTLITKTLNHDKMITIRNLRIAIFYFQTAAVTMIFLAAAFTSCYIFWWFMGIVGFLKTLNALPEDAITSKFKGLELIGLLT